MCLILITGRSPECTVSKQIGRERKGDRWYYCHLLTHLFFFTENDSSAPKFLRQVYQSLWDEETGDLKLNASDYVTIEGQQLSRKFVRSFYQSDKIISFPNQSE